LRHVPGLEDGAFPFEPWRLDAMLLTHAHIDHTGLIPKLTKAGFRAQILCTQATVDLCSVMLPDSGYIQESEVKQLNERNRKRGKPEVEPIYTADDAHAALEHFRAVPYKSWVDAAKGIRARWWNAGHLLGSASIEVEIAQGSGTPLRLLFSGDLGPQYKMLEPDPDAPQSWDYLVCESTYGGKDRLDQNEEQRRQLLGQELRDAAARKGALLIPSFAVERTQEVVTDIVTLMERKEAPSAPIFIDSPLAQKATAIFARYAKDLDHGSELSRAFLSPLIKSTESVEESKAIARFGGFHIIVAASGMCEAGRIRHHLKNHLWRNNATVLLVGFQAEGSLGSLLEKGEKRVTIHGEEIEVRATIRRFEAYSGHADGPELVAWVKARLPVVRKLFLTHGEEDRQLALVADLVKGGLVEENRIERPPLDACYDLESGALIESESRPRISPEQVARLDWHNDLTKLVLDINDEVHGAADEKSRGVVIRRLRRALEGKASGDASD
jgi:metallo-beta-lactamase family protein